MTRQYQSSHSLSFSLYPSLFLWLFPPSFFRLFLIFSWSRTHSTDKISQYVFPHTKQKGKKKRNRAEKQEKKQCCCRHSRRRHRHHTRCSSVISNFSCQFSLYATKRERKKRRRRRKRTMLVIDGWMDGCSDVGDLHLLSNTYSQEKKRGRKCEE